MRSLLIPALCSFALLACSSPNAATGSANTAPSSLTSAATAAPSSTKGASRTLLAHEDVPDRPGLESRIYLIEYPGGGEAAPHLHAEQCVGYVIEGRFESSYGDGPVALVQAGEGFVDLTGEPHRFRNPDPERAVRFVLAGTFRKDEPISRPAPATTESGRSAEKPPAVATGAAPPTPHPSDAPLTEVKRTLLTQRDIPDSPGMESRIYLMEFPPSAESKLHVHTTQGIGYVVEGRFESAFGDGPVTVKRAGEGFVDVPGKPHHFRNPDATQPLRFLFTGTFHKGEALFQVVPQ